MSELYVRIWFILSRWNFNNKISSNAYVITCCLSWYKLNLWPLVPKFQKNLELKRGLRAESTRRKPSRFEHEEAWRSYVQRVTETLDQQKKSEKESKPCGVKMGLESCDYGSSCDFLCRQSRDRSDEKRNKETFKEPQVIRTMGMSTINTQKLFVLITHILSTYLNP